MRNPAFFKGEVRSIKLNNGEPQPRSVVKRPLRDHSLPHGFWFLMLLILRNTYTKKRRMEIFFWVFIAATTVYFRSSLLYTKYHMGRKGIAEDLGKGTGKDREYKLGFGETSRREMGEKKIQGRL